MKHILLVLLIALYWSAHAQYPTNNRTFVDNKGNLTLLGAGDRDALLQAPFKEWFSAEYNAYQPDAKVVSKLKTQNSIQSITIFMGTWCGDSRKEVPRFLKTMDAIGFAKDSIHFVYVDKASNTYKQSPGGEHIGMGLHRVPTIVFYDHKHKEINRIVEHPVETIEKDLEKIADKSSYEGRYPGIALLQNTMRTKGYAYVVKNQKELIAKLKPLVKSPYALNTYGYVLNSAHRLQTALLVYQLNAALFPEQYFTHSNLARMEYQLGNDKTALKSYKLALKKDPEQGWIQEQIDYITKSK